MFNPHAPVPETDKEKRTKFSNGLVSVVIALFGAVPFTLALIYPHRPDTWVGWLVLIAIAIPVVFGLSYIGEVALENRFMSRLGKVGSIVAGVFVVGAFFITLLAIQAYGVSRLGVW